MVIWGYRHRIRRGSKRSKKNNDRIERLVGILKARGYLTLNEALRITGYSRSYFISSVVHKLYRYRIMYDKRDKILIYGGSNGD